MISLCRQLVAVLLGAALIIPAGAESKTIASDPIGVNGLASYTYDPVGNRKQMTSTVPAIPAGLFNYDADDRFTAGDGYDANGNTTSSGGIQNTYDFENRLVQKGGATIVYDGDGNRVAKTVAGATTTYLVDTQNPTGYPQVLVESNSQSGASTQYLYGLALVAESRTTTVNGTQQTQTSYYVFDGHGSVRALANTSGTITDTYDYDAFGNLIHSTGSTLNNYLFAGEQFDPDLGLYYNRARYLNVSTGRFWSMDSFEGSGDDPLSLHKYLYAGNEPINRIDPSGRDFDLASLSVNVAISSTIDAISGFRANGIKGAVEGAVKGAVIGAAFFAFGSTISSGAKLLSFAQASTTAGAIALDTNVLIAALEGGELEAVDAALAGRVPVISVTAAKEFLLKGDVEVLRQFLIERGGRIGTAALATEIAELQTQATLLGRVLAAADASVAGNAIKEGIPLLTRDVRLISFLTAVGEAVESF